MWKTKRSTKVISFFFILTRRYFWRTQIFNKLHKIQKRAETSAVGNWLAYNCLTNFIQWLHLPLWPCVLVSRKINQTHLWYQYVFTCVNRRWPLWGQIYIVKKNLLLMACKTISRRAAIYDFALICQCTAVWPISPTSDIHI